ncbi:hypothetical protein QUB68_24720 [Microcoleus sp. A006_D1]|uniref:hypothetical protein n=1 Tax=Microcoleus sp. A006_D1 TaxID=3055267 RepID=UPI002FCE78D0
MNTPDASLEIAHNYADKVRVLFAASGEPTGERGGRGPNSAQDLAQQAESLSPVSASLTSVLAVQQTNTDPTMRFQSSVKLLAKALTDLEISAYLYQAALEEEEGTTWSNNQSGERSFANLRSIEENLQVILGQAEVSSQTTERGEGEITDIPTARIELSNTVEDTLHLILKRASQTGELAITRVMGLGVTELAQAVGFVGMDIAGVLGQSENVSRLYNAFRDFFNRAYESVIKLLGRKLAETAAKQVLEWIQELKEGAKLNDILERFYQTEQTTENLQQLADSSTANLEQFITAIQSISKLDAAYRQQINWAEKVLQGSRWFGTLSAATLSQGDLLVASLYITLGGYVILVGADYVDSPNLTLLDCVPGVRRIVENHLVTGDGGNS